MGLRDSSNAPSVMSLMLSGFVTGAVASSVYTPVEYAKIHSQIEHNNSLGSAHRIWALIKNEKLKGIQKLYTGHTLTLWK